MPGDGGGQGSNNRVKLAERLATMQADLRYTAAATEQLTAAFFKFEEEQRKEFMALRESIRDVAQGHAVFEGCARQWQADHEQQHLAHDKIHEKEHADQSRKGTIIDIISAVGAALAGILIQPGGTT